jgi:hypothetical protein
LVVFRWHWPRIAFTSQAIEAPKVEGKRRFDHIVRTLRSQGQCCPQFAPNSERKERAARLPLFFSSLELPRSFIRSAYAFMADRCHAPQLRRYPQDIFVGGHGSLDEEIDFLAVRVDGLSWSERRGSFDQ